MSQLRFSWALTRNHQVKIKSFGIAVSEEEDNLMVALNQDDNIITFGTAFTEQEAKQLASTVKKDIKLGLFYVESKCYKEYEHNKLLCRLPKKES